VRLDLRYEYIVLDQPMTGSDRISVGAIHQHHDEVITRNRNLVATLDYTLNPEWGISVQVPWLDRDHFHIHNHMGTPIPETWEFTSVGDVRVTARHPLTKSGTSFGNTGLLLGLKLPTGKADLQNEDGDPAERTLQPGTGTTDFIGGLYMNTPLQLGAQSVMSFVQAQLHYPLNANDDFRPGNQYLLDAGLNYSFAGPWSGLLQVNAVIKDRDRGGEAEPEDSGSSSIWISPGLSYAIGHQARAYGFVQLPLYQHVNGVQLTPSWSAAVGMSWRF